jgi:hypothetical protein
MKKIEVQPALLKFSKNKDENKEKYSKKKICRYNSALNGKSKDLTINNNVRQTLMGTLDINKKKLNTKNNNSFNININKTLFNANKRISLIPMTFKNKLVNNFNLNKDQTFHYFSNLFNKGHNFIDNTQNNLFNIVNNNIQINKNNSSNKTKENKKDNKSKEKDNKALFPLTNKNAAKSRIISAIKKTKINMIKKINVKKSENKKSIKNKLFNNLDAIRSGRRNINKIMSRNKKIIEQKKRIDKYLSANEIFKDVDKHEEKLRHERTEYYGKELISLYKKMLKEKKEIRQIIGKYDKYDISLNFFDFKKKGFPKDYGKSIFSYNKYY